MRITELVNEETISEQLVSRSKHDVLEELALLLTYSGKVKGKDAFLQAIYARENEGSTGIGWRSPTVNLPR